MAIEIKYNQETKYFDAVNDVQEYLGSRYEYAANLLKPIKDCEIFAYYCSFVGIKGFPVVAWYEHFNGGNSWQDFDD